MEVSLLGCEGLPKGCLLSVRSGSARRQAPVDMDKFRLAFPKAALAGEAFKVDVLANLGGASVPFDVGMECYELDLGKLRGQPMRAKIAVRQALRSEAVAKEHASVASPTAACKGIGGVAFGAAAPAAEQASLRGSCGRRHHAALSARKYLDEHNLLQWAETLFQDLIREQPNDPWAFIDKQTAKARSQGPKTAPSGKVAAVMLDLQPGDRPGGKDPEVAAVMLDLQPGDRPGGKDPEAREPPPSPNAGRAGDAEQPGVAPALAGEAARRQQQPLASQAESLRKRVLEALVKASQTDAVAAARRALMAKAGPSDEEVAGAQHLRDQHKEKTVAGDSCLKSGEKVVADDVEALRALAKETLSAAAHDSRLSALLKDPSPGALDATSDDIGMDAIRESARDALLRGSSDGRLAAALGAGREAARDVQADGLRTQARDALLRATRDGSLAAALQASLAVAEEERIAQLKLLAKDALNRALLPEHRGCDAGISRKQVRQTRKKARSALMMALAPEDSRMSPRSSASEDAEMTPRMLRRAEKKARAALLAMVSSSDEQEAAEPADLTGVRQKVFDLLGAASGDGRLHGALFAERSAKERVAEQDVDMDLLRQKAARALEDLFLDEPPQAAEEEPTSDMDTLKERAADAVKVALPRDTDAKMDALKEMAADALKKALLGPPAPVEALEPAVADPAGSVADSLKQQAAKALEAALLGSDEDGMEASIEPPSDLDSLKQQARQALNLALLGSDAEGDDEQEASTSSHVGEPISDLRALKQQTIQALKAALLGSDAEDSEEEEEEEEGEAPQRDHAEQPDSDMQALKQQALQALRASLLGSDADAEQEKEAQSPQSSVADEPDLDLKALKHQARQALKVASLGADTEDSLRDEPGPELQSLKQQVVQALTAALLNPVAEGEEQRDTSDEESLKHMARDALASALLDESAWESDSPMQPASPAREVGQPKSDEASLRQRACESLKPSLLDQSCPDGDSLKRRAREALRSSFSDQPGTDVDPLRQVEEEVREEAVEESEADLLRRRAGQALKSTLLCEPSPEVGSLRPAAAPECNEVSSPPEAALDAPRPAASKVEGSLSESIDVAASAKTMSPSAACRSLFKDSLKDLEARLLERNERLRRDNEAMRLQNIHLKKLRGDSVEFGKLSAPDEKWGLDRKADLVVGGKRRSKSVTRF